jgi:hypothetical protein
MIKMAADPKTVETAVTAWAKGAKVGPCLLAIKLPVLCDVGSVQHLPKQSLIRVVQSSQPFTCLRRVNPVKTLKTTAMCQGGVHNQGPLQFSTVSQLRCRDVKQGKRPQHIAHTSIIINMPT